MQQYRRPSDCPPMIVTAIAARPVPRWWISQPARDGDEIKRGLAGHLARGFATGRIRSTAAPRFH